MSQKSQSQVLINEILLTTLILLLSIPFTVLLVILFVLVFLPFYIYRFCVVHLVRKLEPDVVKALTGLAASQIRDFDVIYEKPYASQVVCLRCNGIVNFNDFRERFRERVVEKFDPAKEYPVLHYPELQQYFVKRMGYVFLKRDGKFDIKNHITFLNENSDEPVRDEDLMKIWESLMIKPFTRKRSAWEFVIIQNYVPNKKDICTWSETVGGLESDNYWVILLRVHHSLADGFAIQKMLSYMSDDVYLPKFSTKVTPYQRFCLNLRAIFLGPYDVLNRIIKYSEDYHALHRPAHEHTHDYFVVESELISMRRIRHTKKKFKVAFTVILVAALSGGIRNFLRKNKKPVPNFISTAIPFTTPDHPDKLTNKFSIATVGLGCHVNDAKERVNYVKEQMHLLTSSSWIKMMNIIALCMACLPNSLLRLATEKSLFSSTYSTQPGPVKYMVGFDSKLLEVNFSYGTNTDSIGLGFSSLTYNDSFRVVVFIDKVLAETREQAEQLVSFITKEFDCLEAFIDDEIGCEEHIGIGGKSEAANLC